MGSDDILMRVGVTLVMIGSFIIPILYVCSISMDVGAVSVPAPNLQFMNFESLRNFKDILDITLILIIAHIARKYTAYKYKRDEEDEE